MKIGKQAGYNNLIDKLYHRNIIKKREREKFCNKSHAKLDDLK